MPYQQRDVVRLNIDMPLPDGTYANHPFLIISCNAIIANEKNRFYTGVMMTASNHRDRFSFPLENLMFEGFLEKSCCQLRLHIIASFSEVEIDRLMTRMKKIDFTQVINQIKDSVLCVD